MNKNIKKFLENTLFLKDIKCIFCNRELEKDSKYCTCDECLEKLPFIREKVCHKCGEPIKSLAEFCMRCKKNVDRGFDKARAVFYYKDELSKAVKDLKYYNNIYLAEYLSAFLLDKYIIENFNSDVVIPAPMSERSLKSRGFNQAELLCESFVNFGLKVNSNCVQKIRETENQAQLGYKDRQTNLIDAFKVVDKNAVKNKNVLIVDDVFTTGATVSEISYALKKAGANRIDILTLCHEMPDGVTN